MAKFGEIIQNFERNLHFLTKRKMAFWLQYPLEPNEHLYSPQQMVAITIYLQYKQ